MRGAYALHPLGHAAHAFGCHVDRIGLDDAPATPRLAERDSIGHVESNEKISDFARRHIGHRIPDAERVP
jgi:hypothetical protein